MIYYVLDENKKTIPCDLAEWSQRLKDSEGRRVDQTNIDGIYISTVFIGLDPNYFGCHPLLFETMIFDKKGDEVYQTRCSTWYEAKEMHKKAIEWAKGD